MKPYDGDISQTLPDKVKSKKMSLAMEQALKEAEIAMNEGFGLCKKNHDIDLHEQDDVNTWFTSISKSYFTPIEREMNTVEMKEYSILHPDKNQDKKVEIKQQNTMENIEKEIKTSDDSESDDDEDDYLSSSSDEEEEESKCMSGILTEGSTCSNHMRYADKVNKASDWLKGSGGGGGLLDRDSIDAFQLKDEKMKQFLTELNNMLNDVDHSTQDFHFKPAIGWSSDGLSLVVRDVKILENQLIPQYFKRTRKFNMFK